MGQCGDGYEGQQMKVVAERGIICRILRVFQMYTPVAVRDDD